MTLRKALSARTHGGAVTSRAIANRETMMKGMLLLASVALILATMAQADGPVSDVTSATRGSYVRSAIGGSPTTYPVDPLRGQTVTSIINDPALPPNPVKGDDGGGGGPIDTPF